MGGHKACDMHVAVVVEGEPPAAILDEAVRAVRRSGGTIHVIGLAGPVMLMPSLGWFAPAPVTGFTPASAESACRLARRVADELPADIRARHFASLGWECPRLLGRL